MPGPRKSGTVEQYASVRNASNALHESNDCAVVAATVATNEPYEKVHGLMAANGRRPRKGTAMAITEATLRALGFDMVCVPHHEFLSRYPGGNLNRNITTHHPERYNNVWADGNTYLLRTAGHILAVVNGVNVDWTRGKALRVKVIYRVVKRA